MNRQQFGISVLLGVVYFLLSSYLAAWTVTLGSADWWYESFGQSNISALARLQLLHSLGLVVAALPFAVLVTLRFRTSWLSISLTIGAVASLLMLVEAIRVYFRLSSANLDIAPWQYANITIDILKVGLLFLAVVALIRQAVPSNNALDLPPNRI